MIIDAHQHFWQLSKPFDYAWLDNPDLERIKRDYLPADLKTHLDNAGVDRSVFVQTQHNVEENRWDRTALMRAAPDESGVVAYRGPGYRSKQLTNYYRLGDELARDRKIRFRTAHQFFVQ